MTQTLIIDRIVPGYGRFKMASGTTDPDTKQLYSELIGWIGRRRRFDLLNDVKAKRIGLQQLLETYRPERAPMKRDADRRRARNWLIYALLRPDTEEIKIGITNRLERRIRDLQHAHARPLVLLGAAPGTHEDERGLHTRFAEYRLRGEWFRWCPEIEQWARSFAVEIEPGHTGTHTSDDVRIA